MSVAHDAIRHRERVGRQSAPTGDGNASTETGTGTMVSTDEALVRGERCLAGASGTPDVVAAHRWFNVAAIRGSERGAALRRTVAASMTKGELVAALRGAREALAA